jgi:hypothetical protein
VQYAHLRTCSKTNFLSASVAAAALLGCLPATAAVLDLAHGMPVGTVVSGKKLNTAGYQFSGDAAAPTPGNIYVIPNVVWVRACWHLRRVTA